MQSQLPHESVFDSKKYVEYQPGTSNLILSVPHGGSLKPATIPNRDAGAVVDDTIVYDHKYEDQKNFEKYTVRTKQDKYTLQIATMVADELYKLTGHRPHVVISHLHRRKMDPNTEIEKATFQDPQAVQAWQTYQQHLTAIREDIKGPGLMLEIHGQTHAEGWVELGYTISGKDLNSQAYTATQTSIRHLAERVVNQSFTIQDLICGPQSLGGLLCEEGYKVVPSPMNPGPSGGGYYSGGHNTEMHGSKRSGVIDAIQVECPQQVRNVKAGSEFASALARAVHKFLQHYYSLSC